MLSLSPSLIIILKKHDLPCPPLPTTISTFFFFVLLSYFIIRRY
jgi:hypothetical protein